MKSPYLASPIVTGLPYRNREGAIMNPRPVEVILARLPGAVLLAAGKGKKKPILSGWQNIHSASMSDPAYLASLDHGGNIGVLLGSVSGGLIALDFDRQEDADAFLACNPALDSAFRTCGARGCQVWARIIGEVPESGDLKNAVDRRVCEIRAGGRQSILWGTHPDGNQYCWLVNAPPTEIRFREIQWPSGWRLPIGVDVEPQELRADRELIAEHGNPFTRSKTGRLTLNIMYFVARFARAGDVLYEPAEGSFYGYDAATGIWRPMTSAALKIAFAEDLKEYALALPANDAAHLVNARTERMLAGLVSLLQGHVEERNAFTRAHGVIPVANGMLHLADQSVTLRPFAAAYRFRNASPVAYDPMAECPRFRRELLEPALASEDVSLIQRYAGACLLGRNVAQKILVLTGTAGGGKSTFLEILERIIGTENVGQLRTEHLAERFEIARLVGKTLLCGKDVPGRFLEESGAYSLKALVGHDLLDAERKNSNASCPVRGDFSVIITCNSRLRVRLDGDAEAWRRRLLIVRYERPRPEQPERDFASRLLDEEGPGILRWMIDGALAHLAEIESAGDYVITDLQRARVDALLAESDSVRAFIRCMVQPCEGADVTVNELVEAYATYCDEMGWTPMPSRKVENKLGDAMQEICRAARRNGIDRFGSAKRGFTNVRLIEAVAAASA